MSVCISSVTLVHPAKAVGWNEILFGRGAHVVQSNIIFDRGLLPSQLGVGIPVFSNAACRQITLALVYYLIHVVFLLTILNGCMPSSSSGILPFLKNSRSMTPITWQAAVDDEEQRPLLQDILEAATGHALQE